MKVHICLWQDGHVIPRMMQWLVDRLGWTMSEAQDLTADINYFAPYLKTQKYNVSMTKSMAWFTHDEPDTWKHNIWEMANYDIDLRLVTASQYLDYMAGDAMRITPGVDLDFFKPDARKCDGHTVIGTSGLTQERKGLHLVDYMVKNQDEIDVQYVLAGNWNYSHWRLDWADMPKFYNSLDVYLCTSLIEGIPVPPLEALACGVPVVIPKGVGMLDELPEMEGIRHYAAGDVGDMKWALEQVNLDSVSPESLREIASQYSVDAWVESHQRAAERLLDA